MGLGGFIKKAKTAAEATAAGAKIAKDVAAAGAKGSIDQVKHQQADRKLKQQEEMEQRRAEWGAPPQHPAAPAASAAPASNTSAPIGAPISSGATPAQPAAPKPGDDGKDEEAITHHDKAAEPQQPLPTPPPMQSVGGGGEPRGKAPNLNVGYIVLCDDCNKCTLMTSHNKLEHVLWLQPYVSAQRENLARDEIQTGTLLHIPLSPLWRRPKTRTWA